MSIAEDADALLHSSIDL